MVYLEQLLVRLVNFTYKQRIKILLILCITVLATVLYSLNKGIIFSDEAWYLLHLNPGIATLNYSQWYSYVITLFPDNLLLIRLSTIILFLVSTTVFAFGFKQFFQTGSLKEYLFLSLAGIFLLWIPAQLIPNNTSFNLIIFYFGGGVFLLGLSSKSYKQLFLWGTLTGIAFSQLVFVMITNLPFYLMILLIAVTLLKEKNTKLLFLIAIILGSLLGLVLFFLFITPLRDVYNNFLKASNYLSFIDSHGIKVILRWLVSTSFYFLREIMLPSILLLILLTNYLGKSKLNNLIIYSLLLYAVYSILRDIIYNSTHLTSPAFIYIFICAIIIQLIIRKEFTYVWLGLFSLSIPFFASLGTDVKFELRSTIYIMPALIFIYFYLCYTGNKNLLLVYFVILFICIGRFSGEYIFTPGWNGYIIAKQNKSLNSLNINQNILIDSERYNIIKELQFYIPPKAEVLVSNNKLWGYVYLLGAKTPILYFNYNESLLKYYFKNNPLEVNCLYLLESKRAPFPDKIYVREIFITTDTIYLKQNFDLILYKMKRL